MPKVKNAEQTVIERRLKPLYELIDSGNSKRAIQEAEKILRKHSDLICAKALKGLALLRLERNDEAIQVIGELENLSKIQILDEGTLKALCHCFKEASTPGRIRVLYENQVNLNPSENLLVHLFLAYVRLHDYKNQQLIARRLCKEFAHSNFSYWQVASIFMQGFENPEMGKKMFFPLAMKMLDTLTSNGVLTLAAVELYELIYETTGDHEKLETLLHSTAYMKLLGLSDEEHFMKITYSLLKRGRSKNAFLSCLTTILNAKGEVNFSYWNLAYDCLFTHLSELSSDQVERILDAIWKTLDDLLKIKFSDQGVRLARLELYKRLHYLEKSPKNDLAFIEEVLAYMQMFYLQPSCYNDVSSCILAMHESERKIYLYFLASIDYAQPNKMSRVTKTWWKILIAQIFANFSESKHINEDVSLLNGILRVLMKQDERAFDSECVSLLIQAVAALIWKIFLLNGEHQIFYDFISLVETLDVKFDGLPMTKFVLGSLYGKGLCTYRSEDLAADLEIKNVLRETIDHFFYQFYDSLGNFKATARHFSEISVFFDQAERDTGDSLVQAYQSLKFGMLTRIVKMNNRFSKSLLAASTDVLNRWTAALFLLNNPSDVIQLLNGDRDVIVWDQLIDNRDFMISSFGYERAYEKRWFDVKENRVSEMIDSCRLRDELMKAVATLAQRTGIVEIAGKPLDDVKNLVLQLKTKYTDGSKGIPWPLGSNFAKFLYSSAFELMLIVLETLINALESEDEDWKVDETEMQRIVEGFVQLTSDTSTNQQALIDSSFQYQALAFCNTAIIVYRQGRSNTDGKLKTKGPGSKILLQGLEKCLQGLQNRTFITNTFFNESEEETTYSTIWEKDLGDYWLMTKRDACAGISEYYNECFYQMKSKLATYAF